MGRLQLRGPRCRPTVRGRRNPSTRAGRADQAETSWGHEVVHEVEGARWRREPDRVRRGDVVRGTCRSERWNERRKVRIRLDAPRWSRSRSIGATSTPRRTLSRAGATIANSAGSTRRRSSNKLGKNKPAPSLGMRNSRSSAVAARSRGRCPSLVDLQAKPFSRSRRAATLLYAPTRTTTRQRSCSGGIPCYARVCGGCGCGDPWMACKGSGVQIPSAPPGTTHHQATCSELSVSRLSADHGVWL
jgi:hypothetical protein